MPSLSLRTAGRIAVRELRSSRAKFAFVVLSVAIGVAALTGVRGFSSSFRKELLLRARAILAADVSVRETQPLTPQETSSLDALSMQPGVERTDVTELLSMASAAGSQDPLLVALKAVDPQRYPFYGRVVLAPAMPLAQALGGENVVVADDLLLRLHLHLGDSIRLGNSTLRIVATVVEEPDRLSGMFAAGPRVLLSQQTLERSGLLVQGSHATRRYLFRLRGRDGLAAPEGVVATLKQELEAVIPEAQVADYREANPTVTKALDGATGLLSLMSLVAMVLGAVGVAMAMRAHLQQRMEAIAIMKSLGATSVQVMKIYLLQTLLLGAVGGVAGSLLGLGVQTVFPLFLERLLHLSPSFRVDPWTVLLGITAGLLTTLLFTLPPLLDIRGVRPIMILRRHVEGSEDPFAARMRGKLKSSGAQLVATVLLLAGLAALAATVADSRQVGSIFALALGCVLLVLFAVSALLLYMLRRFLERTRYALPSSLRHGFANLFRPGNPSAALLAALGLGVMQIGAVYFVQRSVVNEMKVSTAEHLPNLFLLDISPSEVEGVRSLLRSQPEVAGDPELMPVVASRLVAIDGVSADQLRLEHVPRRSLRSMNLTWAPKDGDPPPGDKVIDGHWWSATQAQLPQVAVEKNAAKRLHLRVGQSMTLAAQDDQFTAQIVAIFEADSRHAYSRAEYVLSKPSLQGLPVIWYGGVHSDPNKTGVVRRALYEHYPTVTVIDVAATVETVRQVLLQVTYVIEFLAGFSIVAGGIILASAIAGTRYRRIREVVVLKTLGATRARMVTIFSVEFAVLGLVAGLVGLLFANALAWVLLTRVMSFEYVFSWGINGLLWLSTAALAVLAGWTASFRILGQKPLEVLREE